MLEAQKRLSNSTYEQKKIEEATQNWSNQKANEKKFSQATPNQQQAVQQAAQPAADPKAANWLAKNTWFQQPGHRDMTGFAWGYHEELISSEGIDPRSDEYYEKIDKRMREVFPDYFENQGEDIQEEFEESDEQEYSRKKNSRPAPVVASSKRSNSKKSRNVKLTRTQVQLAHRLGLTNEQYAAQLVKENSNV